MNFNDSVLTKRIYIDGGIGVANTGTSYKMVAGTGDTIYSTIVDTAGYNGIRFILALGTITGSSTVAVQAYSTNTSTAAASAFTIVTGCSTSATSAKNNELLCLESYRPSRRYYELRTIRGGVENSVLDGLIVELFEPGTQPTTEDATSNEVRVCEI